MKKDQGWVEYLLLDLALAALAATTFGAAVAVVWCGVRMLAAALTGGAP